MTAKLSYRTLLAFSILVFCFIPLPNIIGEAEAKTINPQPLLLSTASGSTTADVSIPDYPGNPAYSGITISGAPSNAVIDYLVITFNIDHSYTRDLRIFLGTSNWNNEADPLLERPAPTGDDLFDSWDETLNKTITWYPDPGDTWFWQSQTVNNTWYLAVRDLASVDTGRIDSWNLTIYYHIPQPDLTVTSVTANPTAIYNGSTTSVSFTVANQGEAASNILANEIRLSTDTVINTSDPLLANSNMSSISAGSSRTNTATVTIPASTTPGTYYIGIIADAGNLNAESSETNNTGYRQVTVIGKPDLYVSNITANSSAYVGDALSLSFTVGNQGNYASTLVANEIRLSTDTTINNSDTLLANSNMSSISAGSSRTNTATVTIPASLTPGTYYLGIITDAGNANNESNENNNTGYKAITIYGKPDLAVSNISVNPTSVFAGDPFSVTFTIANQGSAASTLIPNEIRLSTDATITTSDPLLGNSNMSSISAGATRTNSASVTMPPATAPGTYYLGIITDAGNANSELNENNNTGYTQITVLGRYTVTGKVTSRRWPYWGIGGVTVSSNSGQSTVTASDGSYTLTNVTSGSRVITAEELGHNYWATGTAYTQSKTINLAGNTTVNFTEFANKATASVSIVPSKTVVHPGESFTVTVKLKNVNYALSAGDAWLDLSFDSSQVTVGTPSGTGWNTLNSYAPGPQSQVWGVNSSGTPIQITNLTEYLVSANRVGSFGSLSEYQFVVPLTVKSSAPVGSITFKYRGTIGDERDPDSTGSGTRDQQGWNVYTSGVNIELYPLDITGFTVSPTNPSVGIGDSFTVRYQINNPNGQNISTYLLARSRTPGGVYNFLKEPNGQTAVAKTITPGANWYERQVIVYDGSPAATGYSLTGFISPTTNWVDYVDSYDLNNAFTVIAPQPELSAFLANSNIIPYLWKTVSYRPSSSITAKNYDIWVVIDSGQTIPASMPLSQYSGNIYALYVMDKAVNTRISNELASIIVLDIDNRLVLANSIISPAIPSGYVDSIGTRTDNSGASYQTAKSLVSSTIPESLIYRGMKGLDDPSSRKHIYKIILLEMILNQQMSESDLFENLESTWGATDDAVKKVKAAVEAAQITKSPTDPFFSSITDLENSINSDILKNNLSLMSDALNLMSDGAKISGDVYKAYLMQALANAQAEERLRALEQAITTNSLPGQDYLLVQAFTEAKSEYYEIKNSYLQAFKDAAFDGSTLQNADTFFGYIETAMHAWSVIKWAIHPSLQVFKASHPIVSKGSSFNPYIFVLAAMWDNFVNLDGKLHLIRQADLSIVLSRQIESFVAARQAYPSTNNHEQTANILMLNHMRQYLSFLHFQRLGAALDSEWYGVFMLDVIDGLLTFYSAFYPDFNEARADYLDQETLAVQRYMDSAPPYFLLTKNDKFTPLVVALRNNAETGLVVAPAELSVASGTQTTLLFRLKNTGPKAGIYFLSVSMDSGMNVILPPDSNSIWTRYDVGELIYYKDGTPNPREALKLLYETTGTLQPNQEIEVSLTVEKTTSGIANLYYRAAMRAQNAPDVNSNYMRDPASGTVTDQQGWSAKTIEFTQPQPSVSSNLNSLNLELGAVQAITFTLENNGGETSPAYIDVSVSSGLEIVEAFPVFAWDRYPAGSDIWHAGECSGPRPGDYLLYSSVQSQMAANESRSFTLVVKANSLSNQWIKYRAAMNPANSPTKCSPDSFLRAPTTGTLDQQGWPAYTIPVTVWENHPPTITSFNPNQSSINATIGQTIDFSVVAQDQDPQSTLSYVWLRDTFEILGVNSAYQWNLTQADIGQHTIDVVVVDGNLFTSHQWTVVVSPPPQVTSIVKAGNSPTNADNVNYTVTFSEPVSNVDSGDFSLTATGLSGAYVLSVSPGGMSDAFTVTVYTGTGNGTLRLNLDDNDTILNANNAPLGGVGIGNGSYTAGETYVVDKVPPVVLSIVRTSSNPTRAASVNYTVNFSKSVINVDAADFLLDTTGEITGASVTSVSGAGTTYAVVVNTGSGSGTLRLDLVDNDTIQDAVTNKLGGAGEGNGSFTFGDSYTIDKTPPEVLSITRADSDPTNAASVDFIVSFSESVTGVNAADFSFATTGISGVTVLSISGSGATYTVAVSTGSGSGTLRMDLIDNDSIQDALANKLGGVGSGNGTFTSGEFYTIDKASPVVSSILRTNPNPTNTDNVNYMVTFSKAVSGVDDADFILTTTGLTGSRIISVNGADAIYTVMVDTGTGSGTIRLDVVDNDSIQDSLGNKLGGIGLGNGNFTGGQIYTVDKTPPSVLSIVRAGPNPTNATSVSFTVTFSEDVVGVDLSDFTPVALGISGVSVTSVTGTGAIRTVTIDTGSDLVDGTVGLDLIDDDTIQDGLGNLLGGDGPGNGNFLDGEEYAIMRDSPFAVSIIRAEGSPTSKKSVNFTLTFSEPVNGVDGSDLKLTTTGVLNAAIASIVNTGDSTVYGVTVNTGTGNGTIRLDLLDDDSIMDLSGNYLGGVGTGNGDFTSGEIYFVKKVLVLRSQGLYDGWLLEKSENSGLGGTLDSGATTFLLGDDSQNRQYRAILSFNTNGLPDNAIVTKVTLKLRKQGLVGTNPFTTHGSLKVDICKLKFGTTTRLQVIDFQAQASRNLVGTFNKIPANNWYSVNLNNSAMPYVNLKGITQFRLRFYKDDNNDLHADYLKFFSGNAVAAYRPQLIIEYYVP